MVVKSKILIYLIKTAIYVRELGDDYKRARLQKEISIFWRFMELYIGNGMTLLTCIFGKFKKSQKESNDIFGILSKFCAWYA